MNISPSDTDVRQGYPLAENAAAPQVEPPAPVVAQHQGSGLPSGQSTAQVDDKSIAAAQAADKATARETAQKLADKLKDTDTGLKIRVLDDDQSSVQVEIVDEKSKKVLRKIPQDELIKLSASIKEMSGVLVNKPA